MDPADFLEHEARALRSRLQRIEPFALSETMVPAANLSPLAQRAIDRHLAQGRTQLRRELDAYIAGLQHHGGPLDAVAAQRRFALLRLGFTRALTQFDLFADALAQRGQRTSGVWLSGLDALAEDALALPGAYEPPPLLCYLDRGIGAAIRRARTRLPGGGENPVAVIRIPRERLVGSGIASSLVHEVGHQAAALLELIVSLRPMLRCRAQDGGAESPWHWWERWISEIVADLWSVARLGIASAFGLVGVLSLPRPFVFRLAGDDPHPVAWIRVLLACGLGQALYPHPQWQALAALWRRLYPLEHCAPATRRLLGRLDAGIAEFVPLLLAHRAPALGGRTLAQVLGAESLQPQRLQDRFAAWRRQPALMFATPPCLACAVLGQARAATLLSPEQEGRWLARLLTHWALRRSQRGDTARTALAPPAAIASRSSSTFVWH